MWTKERPTSNGLYWVRYLDDSEMQPQTETTIVEINLDPYPDTGGPANYPIDRLLGSDCIYQWEDFEGAEWQPVAPPVGDQP